jgi:hypothetical protein
VAQPESRPTTSTVTPAQAMILNRAAVELARFLCTQSVESVRAWARDQADLASLLPSDFAEQALLRVPGIARSMAVNVLKSMGAPCWDRLLWFLDQIVVRLAASPTPADQATAQHLRQCIAALANNRTMPWYRQQMSRIRDLLVTRLTGGGSA